MLGLKQSVSPVIASADVSQRQPTSAGTGFRIWSPSNLAFICRTVLQVSKQRYYLVFHSISDSSTVRVPPSAACLTTQDEVSNRDHYPGKVILTNQNL